MTPKLYASLLDALQSSKQALELAQQGDLSKADEANRKIIQALAGLAGRGVPGPMNSEEEPAPPKACSGDTP